MNRPERANPSERDLAGALHEVSNALTVVLGWLGDVRGKVEPGEIRDALDVAYSHAHRGYAVARRAIGGASAEHVVARSSASVIDDALQASSREAEAKSVLVRGEHREIDASIDAPDVVLQVLVNLLLNAIAFSPAGGSVTLRAELDGDRMRFRVEDQGPGVDEQRRSSLFQRGRSLRPGGAGIGLAYSHELARRHSGELRLLPSSDGAVFELEWPTSDAPSRTSQRVPPAVLQGLRVLVLEDDEAVLAMVQLGLAARGIEVLPATDLKHARSFVEEARVDAALIDLSPIASDPVSALAVLRGQNRALPVILISGSAHAPQHGLELSGWVRKPFQVSELCDALLDAMTPVGTANPSER